MNDIDYKFFEDLLKRESGLSITPDKMYLLESRLLPVASRFKVQGLEGIAQTLRSTRDLELQRAVVEAMTTNETSFFRDSTPFQRMKEDVLPAMMKARQMQKSIRIWSAACSSGQEPYSFAMMLKELGLQVAGWRIEIVATDLSQEILSQAVSGAYSQFGVQRGLPIQMLMKYFTQVGDKWVAKPELKEMVTFRPANLLTDVHLLGQFDIVLCRNVLIYFDVATKGKVLQSISNVLRQDGALFLGGAETVIGITDVFKIHPDVKGIYVRKDSTFQAIKKAEAPPATGGLAKPPPVAGTIK
jgi:chemotaxis protein methyltransferase CheR